MSDEKNIVSLFQKIQKVSLEVMNIEKNMVVGKGTKSQYNAVSDHDVILAIKKAEEKHKVYSMPVKQEIVKSEVISVEGYQGKQALKYIDDIKMTLKIIDLETGYSETVESFGKGIDPSDKGYGKASTYARKYGLLNAYKIATGEDPDKEASKPVSKAKPESTTAKTELKPDSKEWARCVDFLKQGEFETKEGPKKATIEELQKRFFISEETKQELINQAI
jgi:hypothetical protein